MKILTALAALTLFAAPVQAAPMFAEVVGREICANAKAGMDITAASQKGAALLTAEGPVQQDLINHMTRPHVPMTQAYASMLIEQQVLGQCGTFLVNRELN